MTGKVVIFSPGLWRLEREVAALSGLTPVRAARWRAIPSDAVVAGWGHKPTAARARAIAAKRRLAYLAIEDGWLRSVRPGPGEPPSALVLDRSGIYYDARAPSDLETMLETAGALEAADQATAEAAIDLLRRHRLSKYNDAPLGDDSLDRELASASAPLVLVVDQTLGDASIGGGLADGESFARMVAAALAENPGARIVVKLHPEVTGGGKRGCLDRAALPPGCTVVSRALNPWTLLERVDKVYTVSSQLGFEALMAGCKVVCFGVPFYAGWGLTDDRVACSRRSNRVSLAQLVHAAYFDYCRYFDAWRRHETDFFTAADQLLFLRQRHLANSRPVAGYRITAWKRRTVRAFLDGPAPVHFTRDLERAIAQAQGGAVAAWGSTARRIAERVHGAGLELVTIEDGFLRSVGLGASFTPALSYVFDTAGIYYDPSQPSDLERILQSASFDAAIVARASALIESLVRQGLTKYNPASTEVALQLPRGRDIVLVPGQVADDEAVRRGGGELFDAEPMSRGGANLALLTQVRARRPDAFIIFRPHPDVAAGLRAGHLPERLARQWADHIDTGPSITATMALADRVETVTSLAGFEALIRGKPVTVYGQPFYAGWGLTQDVHPLARRTRRLTIEELVAGVLVVYPRYLDPVSGRPCPVEVAVHRLAQMRLQGPGLSGRLHRAAGHLVARSRHLLTPGT